VNEIAQWAVLVVLALLVLGLLRQVSILLPTRSRAVQSGPPVGREAPKPLLESLRRALPDDLLADGTLVAFVTEDCVGCQKLLADATSDRGALNGEPLVVVAHKPSPGFSSALSESNIPTISDDGRIWRECAITSTPLMLRVDQRGRVAAKEVTHRVNSLSAAGQATRAAGL